MTRLSSPPVRQQRRKQEGRFRLMRLMIFGGGILTCMISFSVFLHSHSAHLNTSMHSLESALASFTGAETTIVTIQSPGNFIKIQQPGRAIVTIEDPEKPLGDPSRIVQQIEVPAPANNPRQIAAGTVEVGPKPIQEEEESDRALEISARSESGGTAVTKKQVEPASAVERNIASAQITSLPITAETHTHEFTENLDPAFSTGESSFCLPWTTNSDEWWTHHPIWEMGTENATHYCFQKIQNIEKKRLYKKIYEGNFHGDCSKTHSK